MPFSCRTEKDLVILYHTKFSFIGLIGPLIPKLLSQIDLVIFIHKLYGEVMNLHFCRREKYEPPTIYILYHYHIYKLIQFSIWSKKLS